MTNCTLSRLRKQYFGGEGAILAVAADVAVQPLHNGVNAHQTEAVAVPLCAAEQPAHRGWQGAEQATFTNGNQQKGAAAGGFTPEQVLGPPRRGLKVVYATDTRPCAALEAAARDADLLCMDATYADDADLPKARLYGHTTCREAGALAAAAAVRRLWLTHYSAAMTDTAPGLAAARTAYPLALAGYDGMAQELEFDKE